MPGDGAIFRKYLKDNKKVKSSLAKDLDMTRTNLYQLFKTTEFTESTIKTIEKVLNINFADLRKAAVVNMYNEDFPEGKIKVGEDSKLYKQEKTFKDKQPALASLARTIEKQQEHIQQQLELIDYLARRGSQGGDALSKKASG
jgi:DNA-directed RNA polymerase specialized sigma subunit